MAPKKKGCKPIKGFLARIDPWAIVGPSASTAASSAALDAVAPPPIGTLLTKGAGISHQGEIYQDTNGPQTSSGAQAPTATPPTDGRGFAHGPDPPHPLGERRDRPSVAFTKRGSFSQSVSQSLTADGKRTALESLETDFYSAGSKKPRASCVRTWEKMHALWFGDTKPVLPLTLETLKCVGALYKAGRYRNFAIPMSSMKSLHLEMGHDWSDLLALTAKRVERSATRGIGPSHNAEALSSRTSLI